MSRMLKALQQIELTRPAAPPPPSPTGGIASELPNEPVRGQHQVEATLAAAEQAVADIQQPVAPDRSCVSPLLRSSIRAGATAGSSDLIVSLPTGGIAGELGGTSLSAANGVVAGAPRPSLRSGTCHPPSKTDDAAGLSSTVLPSKTGATAGLSSSAAPRAGLSKLAGNLKGEVADLGRIILGQLGPARPAAILLTTAAGEIQRGTSLLSLATTLGEQIEGEVLLIGCDCQGRSAADRYGITAQRGLVDLLSGGGRGMKAVQKVGRPPISVLLGRGRASPAQLPKELPWQSLVKQLKQRYSLVILDATSLACAQAAPIARHCDGTYLLVLARQTPRRAALRAVSLLGRLNARLLGCVLVTGERGIRNSE